MSQSEECFIIGVRVRPFGLNFHDCTQASHCTSKVGLELPHWGQRWFSGLLVNFVFDAVGTWLSSWTCNEKTRKKTEYEITENLKFERLRSTQHWFEGKMKAKWWQSVGRSIEWERCARKEMVYKSYVTHPWIIHSVVHIVFSPTANVSPWWCLQLQHWSWTLRVVPLIACRILTLTQPWLTEN